MILGVACLVDAAGIALGTETVASVGLCVYLILAPLRACWVGVTIMRGG